MISSSMPCFLKMPAFSPRYAIEVSQLPRWPTVILRRSAASAGSVAASTAAAAKAMAKMRDCVILLSIRLRPASSFLFRSAQHRRGRDRRIAGLDPHIHHRHLALLDRRDRLLEGGHEIARLGDGVEADGALR